MKRNADNVLNFSRRGRNINFIIYFVSILFLKRGRRDFSQTNKITNASCTWAIASETEISMMTFKVQAKST